MQGYRLIYFRLRNNHIPLFIANILLRVKTVYITKESIYCNISISINISANEQYKIYGKNILKRNKQ